MTDVKSPTRPGPRSGPRSRNTAGPKAGRSRRAVTPTTQALVRESELFPGETLPLLIEPALQGVDLVAWAVAHREQLADRLRRRGGVLFRGFDLSSPETFERLVTAVAGEPLPYDDRMAPRSEVVGNIYTSTDLPSDRVVQLHNESSYASVWPRTILFYCETPAPEGGATPIADCRRVYQRLPEELRNRFAEKGVMYMRNFGHGLGLSWQEVYQTDDPAKVEDYGRRSKIDVEWLGEGRMRTRQVRPAVIEHPATSDPVWFNQVVVFHVAMQPEAVRDELRSNFAEDELPMHAFYGDGTPIADSDVELIHQAYQDEVKKFGWQRGDVMVLDNLMAVHGRDPFQGPRRVLVGMGTPCTLADVGFEERRSA